ncbi:MAG: hypothetical protein HY720_10195 [Planctomycetes bacterium]|nr:hypothetical protein [Planctomycetota bacterium]
MPHKDIVDSLQDRVGHDVGHARAPQIEESDLQLDQVTRLELAVARAGKGLRRRERHHVSKASGDRALDEGARGAGVEVEPK